LRESILNPSATLSAGYQASMPSFEGVISLQELEGLRVYLQTIRQERHHYKIRPSPEG
jgi:hypothetical protein